MSGVCSMCQQWLLWLLMVGLDIQLLIGLSQMVCGDFILLFVHPRIPVVNRLVLWFEHLSHSRWMAPNKFRFRPSLLQPVMGLLCDNCFLWWGRSCFLDDRRFRSHFWFGWLRLYRFGVLDDDLIIIQLIRFNLIERSDYIQFTFQLFILWDDLWHRRVMLLITHDHMANQWAVSGKECTGHLNSLRLPFLWFRFAIPFSIICNFL